MLEQGADGVKVVLPSLTIDTGILLTGISSVVIAWMAHKGQQRIAKSDRKTKLDIKDAELLSTRLSGLRDELREQRQTNIDLRDLNHQLRLELSDAAHLSKEREGEVARLVRDLEALQDEIARLRQEYASLVALKHDDAAPPSS